MENYMKHFDDWRAWSRVQIDNLHQWNKKRWSELCISSVTLRNIKISVFGFLYYAKDIFKPIIWCKTCSIPAHQSKYT